MRFLPEEAAQLYRKYRHRWADQLDGFPFTPEEVAELEQAKKELVRLIEEHEKKDKQ